MESLLSMIFLVPKEETGIWFCTEFCLTFFAGYGEGDIHLQRVTGLQFCSAGAGVFWRIDCPLFFEGEYRTLFEGFAVRAIADLIFVVYRIPPVFKEGLHCFPFSRGIIFEFWIFAGEESFEG